MNRKDDDDRFGMPPSAFQSAKQAHLGIVRMGMFVPTRRQVRSLPAETLAVALDLWMHESPVELIPSNEQIAEVIYELGLRADRADKAVAEMAAACRAYLNS